MKVSCLGAAQNVTGSRFLLETAGSRILIDCGLYQEREYRSRNWDEFPVKPSGIDHVILTHAHIDHCGYLPKLVKDGFNGKVFCTQPTSEIAMIALMDAAHLQEMDAELKRGRHQSEGRKGTHPEVPLYTVEDVKKIHGRFKTVSYEQMTDITQEIGRAHV